MTEKRAHQSNRFRVRPEDIGEAIYKPEDRVAVGIEDEDRQSIAFTIFGKEDELLEVELSEDANDKFPTLWDAQYTDKLVPADERDEAYAKLVKFEGGERTKVKYFCKKGHDGRLLDPLSLIDNRHQKRRLGIDIIQWREVNKQAFKCYIRFLKTKNRAWLQNAEREVF